MFNKLLKIIIIMIMIMIILIIIHFNLKKITFTFLQYKISPFSIVGNDLSSGLNINNLII